MARKTVKVDVPTNKPDKLIALGQSIMAKHIEDGADSPLDQKKMAKLAAVLAIAVPQNKAAKDADGVAQKARQVRDGAMGTADGQTASTMDTGLNLINYARDQLLVTNEGAEEALTGYGFDVVVGSAKAPKQAAPKAK